MAKTVNFKGAPLELIGQEIVVGQALPEVTLTANDMSDLPLSSFRGKVLIISVIPSIDTPVCSLQTKRFNQEAANLGKDVAILTVSKDLPFAQKRWCGAEGVAAVQTASDFKHQEFGTKFGVLIKDWSLLARAIFVADTTGKILYAQYVPEVSQEPDYGAVLGVVKQALAQ